MKKTNLIIVIVILLFTVCNIHSAGVSEPQKIQLKVSENITANAAFYEGEAGKPSILILHGFLLNHNFPTIKRLAESLHGLGYTILMPSLSLGLNKRQQSLPCEAIHTHSLTSDIAELDQWVKWLARKSGGKIILLGHSTGSLVSIFYLAENPSAEVSQLIFLSIPTFGPNPYANETVQYAEKARELIQSGDQSLHEFGLSYCKKYTTTAKNFLSYYQLSQENTFKALTKIALKKTLIIGDKDSRIDQQWNLGLVPLGITVIAIAGANHFFDYEYEFDLLDTVESILKTP